MRPLTLEEYALLNQPNPLWLVEIDLSETYLVRANFEDADLEGCNLAEACLRGANLIRANLSDASLTGTDLRQANLAGVNLQGANLEGADLREANLASANLRGANLYGTLLQAANLEGVAHDRDTRWPHSFTPPVVRTTPTKSVKITPWGTDSNPFDNNDESWQENALAKWDATVEESPGSGWDGWVENFGQDQETKPEGLAARIPTKTPARAEAAISRHNDNSCDDDDDDYDGWKEQAIGEWEGMVEEAQRDGWAGNLGLDQEFPE